MPGADGSQFTAMRRFSNQTVPPKKGKDPHYQAPIMASGVGLGLAGFLPSLRKRAVANFYVSGKLSFTYGVVKGSGNYTAIIAAIARSYRVDPRAVKINIKSGSIILNFTIYYGTTPPTIPSNSSFIGTVTSAILNNSITNLTFNGPATSTTLTITTNVSGATSTQVTATSLFNPFKTSGVSLPSRPAFSCVFDNVGNYFLTYLHKIYKVTPNGDISLFAGSDDPGYVDGNGSDARFYFSLAGDYGGEIAVDSANNLYVADTFNHRIRMITPDGDVLTLAGSGEGQFDTDGVGLAADISTPLGITMGPSGNLYVSSLGRNIRKINIEKQDVTTLDIRSLDPVYKYVSLKYDIDRNNLYALDYSGSSNINVAYLIKSKADEVLDFQPFSIVRDSAGNLYVANTNNSKIRKIDTDGNVTTIAGSIPGYLDDQGTDARFDNPHGLAIDSDGNLYVADTYNHKIRKIDTSGNVTTFAGSSQGYLDGQGTDAQFTYPIGLAIDSANNLYDVDTNNGKIRKIDTSGNVTTIAGSSQGYLDGQGTDARFYIPRGITIDSDGNLYVADTYNNKIRKITPSGDVTTIAGSSPGYADGQGTDAQFANPYDITIDSSGNLYVADTRNHRIRKITPSGDVTTIAGSSAGHLDGQGTAAQFITPASITIDSADNLYVADTDSHTIRKITPSGQVTTIAGTYNAVGSADGIGSAALFSSPLGITPDSSGNLYVTDTNNHTIRKITSTRQVTTIAGTPNADGSADGIGPEARFNFPLGIAADSSGNLYLSDNQNHRIRKITFI